jgi:hypothetical protein
MEMSKNSEVRRYLMTHERKPLVLKNCLEQIKFAERSNISKRFDVTKYNLVIKECAKIFAKAALGHAEQRALSRIERDRRVAQHNRIENIKAEFEADQKEWESKKLVSRPGSVAR